MTRNLEVEMLTTDNEELKKSISYANPTASDDNLLTFTEKLVGLTTNTHVRTKKIDTSVLLRGE